MPFMSHFSGINGMHFMSKINRAWLKLSMRYTGRINLKEEQGAEKTKLSHNNHAYMVRGLGGNEKMWEQKARKSNLFSISKSMINIIYNIKFIYQDIDSHLSDMILTQLKNGWHASLSWFLHNGHWTLLISIFLILKLLFVGSPSRINLQAKNKPLLGIFNFHNVVNSPSWFSFVESLSSNM